MPIQRSSATMMSFLLLFSSGALLVLFWVTLESLFIKRLTFSYLFLFSIPATVVLLLGMIGIMMLYVWLRLRKLERLRAGTAEGASDQDEVIGRGLIRLPSEIFWGTVIYGGLFIPIYHIVHFLVEGNSLMQVEDYYWYNFLRSFLYEQTITLSAAILHYAVSRRLVRPMLITLSVVKGERWPDKSFLSMLSATFAGLLLVNLFSILWYVMVAMLKDESVELEVLGPLIMLDTLFAATIFILLTFEFRRELQVFIVSIRNWLNGNSDLPYSRLPVLSYDEVGQLAVAFNGLQDQVDREYEELSKELKLARQVQLQLMPPSYLTIGAYRIEALTASRNTVGNGFYDIIPNEHGGFAAIAGGIKGVGMPAALQMSAALLLLRAEVEHEDTPEDMLSRFNRGFANVFPQEGLVPLSLVLVDAQRNSLCAARQDRMKMCIFRCGGEGLEGVIPGEELQMHPGDQLLLYSVSAAEAAEAIVLEDVGSHESPWLLEDRLTPWLSDVQTQSFPADEDFTLMLITRRKMEVENE